MRMHRAVGAVIVSLCAVAGMVRAQDMPKPAPEMAQLDYFVGTWNCQGKSLPSPFGPAGDLKGSVQVTKDLNGFWQSGTVKASMPGAAPSMPFEGRFHVTYDPGAKGFVMLWVDNMGGWSQSRANGWKGDTLVYDGESHMGPQTFKSRDTFVRSGAGSMKHTWEASVNGKWMTLGEETCQKK